MGTKWGEVISNYAAWLINDQRLQAQANDSPALYFRTMAGYMTLGLPKFALPPEMADFLVYTAPLYDDYVYTAASDMPAPVTIATGCVDFELCSAALVGEDIYGNPYFTPVSVTYDNETGNVIYDSALVAGQKLQIDFYTDGEFTNTLSAEQMRIIGLCTHLAWEGRYISDWLNRTPKAPDKSMALQNTATQEIADTKRFDALLTALYDEIRLYAQNVTYRNIIPPSMRAKL